MSYNYDDYKAVTGEDQLNAEDVEINNVANGDYDEYLSEEDLETLMDAEEDEDDEANLPDADAELAREVVKECVGVDEKGNPKAVIGLSLAMVNPYTEHSRTIAEQATGRPVVEINKRFDFIEIALTFKTPIDSELRTMWGHFERFGLLLNNVTELSQEAPSAIMAIVPYTGVGAFYIVAANPIGWYLQPDKVGGEVKQIRLLYHCEDVSFFQTDEMDIESIGASVIREMEAEANAIEKRLEREEEERLERQRQDERMAQMRRDGRY